MLKGTYVDTVAGSGTYGYLDGKALSARFGALGGTAVDASYRIYVADQGNSRIRMKLSGNVITLAGVGKGDKDGPVTSALFNEPNSIALAPSGDLFNTEVGDHMVRKLSGTTVSTVAGSSKGFQDGPAKTAKFNSPMDIARDSLGRLYVADYENNRIRIIYP